MANHSKNRLGSAPFARILPPFTVGILLQMQVPEQEPLLPLTLLASSLALGLLSRWTGTGMRDAILVKGASMQLLLCTLGMVDLRLHDMRNRMPPVGQLLPSDTGRWILVVSEPPEERNAYHRTFAETWRSDGDSDYLYAGRCLLYFRKQEGVSPPAFGTRLMTVHPPSPILNKGNPGGFDAQAYYHRQGIAMNLFLDADDWIALPGLDRNRLEQWAFGMRDRMLGILQENIRDPDAIGIAEALLIGYRGHLDRTVADAYAGTGVIHIIAISGLHIGMIYAAMTMLAGLVLGRTAADRYRPLIVIPFIWLFGFMTGSGASVMRSVCMFSMVGLGKALLGRRGRPVNTLCATAFLLLAYHPQWIADIGFQLSFAAVAGIMVYHPSFSTLPGFENKLLRHLWDMVAMTLAAQLLTTPLILHHFGRFPLLFLFTNLVTVPLSSLVLFAEILLCLVAPLQAAAKWTGGRIEAAILWMNEYVADMDAIPNATLEGMTTSATSTVLLYGFVVSLTMALRRPAGRWILATLSCMSLFASNRAWEAAQHERQRILVVPHQKAVTSLFLGAGRKGTWHLSDTAAYAGLKEMMSRHEERFGIREVDTLTMPASGTLLVEWDGRSILLLGRDAPHSPVKDVPEPDLVILSQNTRADPVAWFQATGCKEWVADGSNSLWKIQEWKSLVAGLPLRLHPTSELGAFVLQKQGSRATSQ